MFTKGLDFLFAFGADLYSKIHLTSLTTCPLFHDSFLSNADIISGCPLIEPFSPTKVITCEICGEKVTGDKNYNSHKKRTHTGSWPCPVCGKVFKSQHHLPTHNIRQVHGVVRVVGDKVFNLWHEVQTQVL